MQKIEQIPIDKIKVGEHELRASIDEEELGHLRVSIRRIGIITPLTVVAGEDSYTLVAGHRRLKAAMVENFSTVPAIVIDERNTNTNEVALAENIFRQDLTPIEVACGIRDTIDQGIMNHEQIAAALHRSVDWVNRQIAMLNWPGNVLQAIQDGWLSVSAAENLALIPDDTYRDFLLRQACANGATARTTAAWLQAYRSQAPAETAVQAQPISVGRQAQPLVPQAPCAVCATPQRTDQLANVLVCIPCLRDIQTVSQSG